MKKVYYSVTRYGKKNVDSMSGVGYITDEDLIIACSSKEQKPYIRVFEDCLKDCYPIAGKTNEFKGKDCLLGTYSALGNSDYKHD